VGLTDSTSLSFWPRCATAVHPRIETAVIVGELLLELKSLTLLPATTSTLSPALRAALGEHLSRGEAPGGDPWLLARLRDLDRRFVGALPGFLEDCAEEISFCEQRLARRRFFGPVRTARPSLPASVVRVAQILGELAPKRVYLEDDVDGLAVLLGRSAGVTVVQQDEWSRQRLRDEVLRAGLCSRVETAKTSVSDGSFDLAMLHAGPPRQTHAALTRALAATRPRAVLAVSIRSPWDEAFWSHVSASGLSLESCHREVSHFVVPPAFVLDGAADLAVFRRGRNVKLADVEDAAIAQVRARPHLVLDFEDLAPDRLDAAALTRWADLLARTSPRPEAARHLERHGGREIFCWIDTAGFGLIAQLRRDHVHLQLMLAPYDPDLETSAVYAVFHTLADDFTRLQAQATRRFATGAVP
jgi:hypothetical protein